MNYPNNIKKTIQKKITYSNRGMDLEHIINEANKYYLEKNIALIYKKPTSIGIVKSNGANISKAYFKEKSTLDYNGLYKGYYIEFDAKETKNRTSFPLANIHFHQLDHIKKVIEHNGIIFLIILMNNCYYLLNGLKLISFIENNSRKSIPYDYIKNFGFEIKYNYLKGLDYINIVDNLLEDKNEETKYKSKQ